jgi:hypothetical protein
MKTIMVIARIGRQGTSRLATFDELIAGGSFTSAGNWHQPRDGTDRPGGLISDGTQSRGHHDGGIRRS